MISITDNARFRQRVIKYSIKHGVTEAYIRYKVLRSSILELCGNLFASVIVTKSSSNYVFLNEKYKTRHGI